MSKISFELKLTQYFSSLEVLGVSQLDLKLLAKE